MSSALGGDKMDKGSSKGSGAPGSPVAGSPTPTPKATVPSKGTTPAGTTAKPSGNPANKPGGAPGNPGTTTPKPGQKSVVPPVTGAPTTQPQNQNKRPGLWTAGSPVALKTSGPPGNLKVPEPAAMNDDLKKEAQAPAGPEHETNDLKWKFDPAKKRWTYAKKTDNFVWLPPLSEKEEPMLQLNGQWYKYAPVAGGIRLAPEATGPSAGSSQVASELYYDSAGKMLVVVSGPNKCAELFANAEAPAFVRRTVDQVQGVSFIPPKARDPVEGRDRPVRRSRERVPRRGPLALERAVSARAEQTA